MKNKTKSVDRGKQNRGEVSIQTAISNGSGLESVLEEITTQSGDEVLEQDVSIECPYCNENFDIKVTSEDDGQVLYEDCQVCCRSLTLNVHDENGEFGVEVARA
jgi:hypothetical protein